MIRTFFGLSSLLILSLFAAGCDSKPKLAVVDAEVVYAQSVLSEKGKAHLQSLSSGFEEELARLQKNVDAAPEEEKKPAQEELQKKYGEIQQQFSAAQQNVGKIITESFDTALEKSRVKNGYDMILLKNAVLASEARFDATAQVLDELNGMAATVDFSVPPLQAPKAIAADSGISADTGQDTPPKQTEQPSDTEEKTKQ